MLEIHGLGKRFGDVVAVDDANLDIAQGEFFTLIGPSGCGKTTLLRLIGGFIAPDSGSIRLDGHDLTALPPERRPVHTVFQSYALFPHLSVARNVAFPLEMTHVPRGEIERRVTQALDEVSLRELARRHPHELSGGQRQRVAIARALIDRPRVLLLDEPLGALDAKLRVQMKQELVTLQRDLGIGFVYVTHDQGEALALSRRIAVMNRGRIEQVGEPAPLYLRPANRFVADFIGQCNLRDAAVVATGDGTMEVEVAGLGRCAVPACSGAHIGLRGAAALRPESVSLRPRDAVMTGASVAGRVRERLYEGDVTYYVVELGDGSLLRAMRTNDDPTHVPAMPAGTDVALQWAADTVHFIPDQSP